MQLLSISTNPNVTTIASDVRNVCNATLSVLFTSSLFIWGFLVKRREDAWRTDGGTAAFGAAALTLALSSTALNFLYVPKEEEYMWLPGFMWAVVLWQSFLGWWWWAGAGSGSSDRDVLDAVAKREEKRRRRERERLERKEKRQEEKEKRRAARHVRQHGSSGGDDSDEADALAPSPSSSASTASGPRGFVARMLPTSLRLFFAQIRQAHVTAAHAQAVERVERIRDIQRESRARPRAPPVATWGPGSSFGLGFSEYAPEEVELRERRGDGGRKMNDSGDEWENEENEEVIRSPEQARVRRRQTSGPNAPVEGNASSMWWWGPLRRWRLKDSTVYS